MHAMGSINGTAFHAWLLQALVPVLQPGDIVVMNSPSSHKVAGVATSIEAASSEKRYLPIVVRITLRSNKCSLSLRYCLEEPLHVRYTPLRLPSALCSINSFLTNANAISAIPVAASQHENTLAMSAALGIHRLHSPSSRHFADKVIRSGSDQVLACQ